LALTVERFNFEKKITSRGLRKQKVATWVLGATSAFALRERKKNTRFEKAVRVAFQEYTKF
jgi:hypothetical protein